MRTRLPKYGDFVFVPDEFGTWVNGVCNGPTSDGRMLVGVAKGAHASGAVGVVVDPAKYLEDWAWPEDMPMFAKGAE